MYPGLTVKVNEDIKGLTTGSEYQVMHIRHYIAFVGVNGWFAYSELGGKITPVYSERDKERVKESYKNRNLFVKFMDKIFGCNNE